LGCFFDFLKVHPDLFFVFFRNKYSNTMIKRYSGVVVPMVSPLTDTLNVDAEAVGRLVRLFAKHHIDPLVLGTTGESPSLGLPQSERLLEAAVSVRAEGQLIYAGVVLNEVQEIIARCNRYIDLGADVLVITLPAYYTLTPAQMERFFLRIADEIQGPVMIYNIRATTQMSIPFDVIERLSKHPNIHGLKDSERDELRMKQCITAFCDRDDFSYFCGWGAQSAGSLQLGSDGIVPSTGNMVPEMYESLYTAALRADWELCFRYQQETDQVAQLYQKDRTLGESLQQLKLLMSEKGLCNSYMMPPL
jgi:4-hydroxy-tetrahydrodipicolinate synthase